MDKARVLVVDDELGIRRFLHASLPQDLYEVRDASTGAEGLSLIAHWNPDVVLLDLGLPDIDGLKVAKDVRTWSQVPIIVLSARGKEQDKVEALDAGADDYLTKPFGLRELLARVRVALRHAAQGAPPEEPVYEFDGITIDIAAHRVLREGEEIKLTPIEFKLLAALAKHAGKVMTHRQLLTEVWGPAYVTETHYLRVYMAQLRHKIEPVPANPKLLVSEPGVGYRLVDES